MYSRLREARPRGRAIHLFSALVACLLAHAPAAAQTTTVRPWTPPSADSVITWAAEARSRFQTARGDSATGPNQRAYDLVGKIGRRLLLSIGRGQWIQAPAMDQVMDSLSLDTDVIIDPAAPDFVLLLVRNPYKPKAHAVGYLYWHKDQELRYQGVVFTAVWSPRMRVWWTSRQQAPYEWGILSRERDPQGEWQLLLLRLTPDGTLWNLTQYEGNGPALGSRGQAFWTDINGDERPEIVSWIRSPSDSGFSECPGCPGLVQELIFTERERGYELHDSRLLPTPYSSFMLFVRLLRDRNRAAAARLLENPAGVDAALAAGWGSRAKSTTWSLEYAEPDQPWPRWLAMKLHSATGDLRYVVHFTQRDGRWIIRNWLQPVQAGKTPPTQGARRP
jgi:hypothetical protein